MFRLSALRRHELLASLMAIVLAGCVALDPGDPSDGGDDGGGDGDGSAALNNPPIAVAGENAEAAPGELVVLSGVGSRDPDGDRLVFFWRQVDGDPTVVLDGRFSALPRFTAPALSAATTLTFRLEVSDGLAFSGTNVQVTITPE